MADQGSLQWRPLPHFPGLPQLFVSATFGTNAGSGRTTTAVPAPPLGQAARAAASSYTIRVTDLATVWAETLDKKGILKRSLIEESSIDLFDADAEQWSVFLSKLAAAFDETSPDHARTSLTLACSNSTTSSSSSGSGTGGDLVLVITCVLPEPLEPLRWPVLLSRCPGPAVTSHLVLPLLRAWQQQRHDEDDLVRRLREKDAVITRLVDKLEAMGAGLESVFHALPAKRKTSRAAAEEKVKGLAVFSEKMWREEGSGGGGGDEDGDVASFVRDAFRGAGARQDHAGHGSTESDLSKELDNWWSELGSEPIAAVPAKPEANLSSEANEGRGAKDPAREQSSKSSRDADDDDFQVQNTPPHLQFALEEKKKLGRGTAIKSKYRSRSSSGEDDDDASIPDSHPAPAAARRGNPSSSQGGAPANSTSQSSHTIPVHDDETASESDGPQSKPPAESAALPTRKSRLGAIGGRNSKDAAKQQPAPENIRSPETIVDDGDSSPAPAPARKAQSSKAHARQGDNDSENTASGSDSDLSMVSGNAKNAQSPPPLATARQQGKSKGELGKIEGRGASRNKAPTPSPPSAQEEEQPPVTASRPHDGQSTVLDDNAGSPARSTTTASAKKAQPKTAAGTEASKPPPRRTLGTIGKIGGKKHTATSTTDGTAAATGDDHDSDGAAKKRIRQESSTLGTPGTSTAPTSAQRTAQTAAAEPEDDEHRAERKRAELARELERKAAAPAKKKRRF